MVANIPFLMVHHQVVPITKDAHSNDVELLQNEVFYYNREVFEHQVDMKDDTDYDIVEGTNSDINLGYFQDCSDFTVDIHNL